MTTSPINENPAPAPSKTDTPEPTVKPNLLGGLTGGSQLNLLREGAVTLAAFVLAFLLGAVLMIVSDPEILGKFRYLFARPGDALDASWDKISSAYSALLEGSVGSWYAITETTAAAAPLICAGLGVAVGMRVGLFNIGGQGQAIWGSIIAAWIGFALKLPMAVHIPFAILGGVVAGALWGGLAGLLRARFGAHEVITTIMLNYIAAGLLMWLLGTTTFQRPGRADLIAPFVEWTATFPRLAGTRLHLGFFIALAAAFLVWWLLDRTKLGFQIRAVGANPDAAATAGMHVPTILVMGMLISGALTGLAGAQAALAPDVSGVPTPLTIGMVGSIGFDAITVALLGRSKPLGVVLAGLLFGALNAGSLQMQGAAQTPAELASVLQALIVIFVAAPTLVRTLVPFLKERKKKVVAQTPTPAVATSQGVVA